jgi:ParB/RepB/Spo0J family partition protein
MTIERMGYYEADLDTIERSAAQARQANVNKNLDDLALSIEVQGLMEPVLLVEIEKDRKYELIDGQRRFLAFSMLRKKNPQKFGKIPSFRYKNTMEEWEKKAISINANLTQQEMEEIDKVSAVTAVYNQFDSIKMTCQKTGMSESTIRRYVKFNRLPEDLKKAVEKGELKLSSAVESADLYAFDPTNKNNAPVKDMLETAREMEKLVGKQKKRVKELVKTEPDKPKLEIITEVKKTKRKTRPITIEVESDTYGRIDTYREKKEIDSVPLAAVELVEDGLKANDL